ncbi:hypothetical protein DFS33DRAFT_1382302 [Desarmillaria ectypa]|nr:hypothetical protein DFS33DRAFT_1382302 [Desarmillaria ectypa]
MAVESPLEAQVGRETSVEPDLDDGHNTCETQRKSLKPRLTVPMMPVPGQAELTLHSPSTIIGTPFDIDSPRFEYPFPESSSCPTETLHSLTSAASSISSLAFLQSSLNHDIPALLPVRTKVRTDTIPIPPGLVEKRHRWSLNERKMSGQGEDGSDQNKGDQQSKRNNNEQRKANGDGTAFQQVVKITTNCLDNLGFMTVVSGPNL